MALVFCFHWKLNATLLLRFLTKIQPVAFIKVLWFNTLFTVLCQIGARTNYYLFTLFKSMDAAALSQFSCKWSCVIYFSNCQYNHGNFYKYIHSAFWDPLVCNVHTFTILRKYTFATKRSLNTGTQLLFSWKMSFYVFLLLFLILLLSLISLSCNLNRNLLIIKLYLIATETLTKYLCIIYVIMYKPDNNSVLFSSLTNYMQHGTALKHILALKWQLTISVNICSTYILKSTQFFCSIIE